MGTEVGHGRGTMAHGQIAGHLGNNSHQAAPPGQLVGIAGVQEQIVGEVALGLGQTLPSVHGTLRVKPNIPAIGKRKFEGGPHNQGDIKRRYGALANFGNNWGSQPLPQQPLGANGGEQWYTDTYSAWS
uniref:Uncharacterized protein n=1 Tax=Anopheles minimus TaxID=112268 RepID=A0A182VRB3_9DIPT